MLGDTVNNYLLDSSPATTPSAEASALGVSDSPTANPGDVGSYIKKYITGSLNGEKQDAPPAAPATMTGGAIGGTVSPVTGVGENKATTSQTIGQAMQSMGAGFKNAPQPHMSPIEPINAVPNFGNMQLQMPQAPMQPLQIPQMAPPPPMAAMSDIRTKWEIQRAHKDMDSLLNTVYQNIIKKRAK